MQDIFNGKGKFDGDFEDDVQNEICRAKAQYK